MKKFILSFILFIAVFSNQIFAQAQVDVAVDVSVKTVDSQIIELFSLLDADKIVVINFFSTSCGPCQTFANDFQVAYENFGMNQSNVFFLGVNYNGNNYQVEQFASIYGLTLPLASGLEGMGNEAFEAFEVVSYPTVIVITPDYQVVENYIWEPTATNITEAVLNAGGVLVGLSALENESENDLMVLPNPVQQQASFRFSLDSQQHLQLLVSDLAGRTILSKAVNGVQGENHVEISAENLIDGMYIVTLMTDSQALFKTKMLVNN
ncbi:MAG: redoxin domain-containing protein [Bacteroidetes bacterium]|jgi:thiol-disulfide isomerase/thioredoxin|nr:redoxin domain-containing protein [Bacteroidota bacterium]